LLDMGFPRQTINNWVSGRVRPSRLSCAILKVLTGKNYGTRKRAA
jgi:DNA-binding transcriptional regulator YiaG